MKREAYDAKALFALLLVCRLFVSFAFIGTHFQGAKTGDNVAAWFFLAALLLVCLVPVAFYLKTNGDESLLTAARKIHPALSRGLGLFYLVYFLLTALATLLRFDLFCGSVMLPGLPTILFSALLLGVACYGAYQGLGTLIRAGEVAAVVLLPVIAVVAALLAGQAKADNLTPLFYDGVSIPLSVARYSVGVTAEIAAVPLLADRLKGKKVPALFFWAGGLLATIFVMSFLTAAVLGAYGNGQMFPLYTVTVLAQTGAFRRADAIQSGVWTLAVIVKVGFFLYLAALALKALVPVSPKTEKRAPLFFALPLLAGVWFFTRDENTVLSFFDSSVFSVFFAVGALLLPLALSLKKKRNIQSKGGVL